MMPEKDRKTTRQSDAGAPFAAGNPALGLKRGTVALEPHDERWAETAKNAITLLRSLLPGVCVDIQHVGSTAIRRVCAKPIIDIAAGVRATEDIMPYVARLGEKGIVFRGAEHGDQLLFVMGDFAADTRTHHIHVVQWNGAAWNNYVNFRDYLNAFEDKADEYDRAKRLLAERFADDRGAYTAGKQPLIERLLREAAQWRRLGRVAP